MTIDGNEYEHSGYQSTHQNLPALLAVMNTCDVSYNLMHQSSCQSCTALYPNAADAHILSYAHDCVCLVQEHSHVHMATCAHLQHLDRGLYMTDSLTGASNYVCAKHHNVFASVTCHKVWASAMLLFGQQSCCLSG